MYSYAYTLVNIRWKRWRNNGCTHILTSYTYTYTQLSWKTYTRIYIQIHFWWYYIWKWIEWTSKRTRFERAKIKKQKKYAYDFYSLVCCYVNGFCSFFCDEGTSKNTGNPKVISSCFLFVHFEYVTKKRARYVLDMYSHHVEDHFWHTHTHTTQFIFQM